MADHPVGGWIVDTNVISRRSDSESETHVARWLRDNAQGLRLSVVTIAEMRRGLLLAQTRLRKTGAIQNRQSQETKLAWYRQLRSRFSNRLIAIDADVAERWAEISVRFPSIRDGDKALLATALVHGLGIATRNVRDFQQSGVALVNPFDPQSW